MNGLVRPAMVPAVRLLVAVQAEGSDGDRPVNLLFGNGARHPCGTERRHPADAQLHHFESGDVRSRFRMQLNLLRKLVRTTEHQRP